MPYTAPTPRAVSTVPVVSTASNAARTLAPGFPTGTTTGDLCVAILQKATTAGATTAPTGWTLAHTYNNAYVCEVWYKKLGTIGGEPVPTFQVAAGTNTHWCTLRITSYINAGDAITEVASVRVAANAPTTVTMPTVSASYDNSIISYYSMMLRANTGLTTWTTATEVDDTTVVASGANWNNSQARYTHTTSGNTPTVQATYTGGPGTGANGYLVSIVVPPVTPVFKPSTDTAAVTESASKTVVTPAPGPDMIGQTESAGTGQDLVLTYPGASASGDYLTAFVHFYRVNGIGAAPTVTTPSGWTLLETQDASGGAPYTAALFGRFRGAETSVTVSAETATNMASAGAVYAYRNVDPGVPVVDSAINYGLDTDNTYSTPTLTTTGNHSRIWKTYLANGGYQGSASASWASSSEVSDGAVIYGSKQVNLSTAIDYLASPGTVAAETITQSAVLSAITKLGMDKSGSFNAPANSTAMVTGWTPQSGTASGDIVSNQLVVNGSGRIRVTAQAGWSFTPSQVVLAIYRNNTLVSTGDAYGVDWEGDVAQGDTIDLRTTSTYFAAQALTSGSLDYVVMGLLGSDTFDGTGPLNSANWTTVGGGTISRVSGEANGVGTPSFPLSYAYWNTQANSDVQTVQAKYRWNGYNPAHSTAGVVVRADPFQSPVVNPGTERGVQASATYNLEFILYEDIGQPDNIVFAPGAGTYNATTKYPENSVIELRTKGTRYSYYVNGVFKRAGTISTASGFFPLTYRTVGIMIQDDSAESGGGDPPGALDDFVAYHEITSSPTAHLFTAAVALQVPQNWNLPVTDTAAATDAATGLTATTGFKTDTAGVTEAVTTQKITSANAPDAAVVTESGYVTATRPATADTAIATEPASTLTAATGYKTDTAVVTESAFVSNAVQSSDAATVAESVAIVVAANPDSATATDKALPFPFDYAAASEPASSLRISGTADAAAVSESAFATNAAQASPDAAVVTESSKVSQARTDDAAVTAETSSVTATSSPTDNATVTESARIIVVVTGDSAAAVDTTRIMLSRTDTATETDGASIAVSVFGSDSATATESSKELNKGATDSAVWGETAYKSVSGQLVASRKTVVAKEVRVYRVQAENRRILVTPEYRLVKIGEEL